MRKLIGPHVAGQWANKLDILRQWQPPFVVVLSPNVDKVQQLREACPDAIVVGRFYHDDSHYAENIRTRPEAFADEIHGEIIGNPVTPLLDYVQTNNEVCQDWSGIQQLNKFTERWMYLADQSQVYKCAILAFSVGNPDMPYKPGDPAGFDGRMLYWQQVLPSLNYAQRNDHLLLLHAYGYPSMLQPDADWYIYRYERQVQANLETLGVTSLKYAYGEIGIDRLIVGEKGGYKVITSDQGYVNQLLQWERDLQGQDLLLGGAIFTFGNSGGWETYDIADTNVAPMIAAHYVDRADEYEASGRDYQSPPVMGADNVQEKTYAPYVPNESPTVTAPDLPERDWDPRLTDRGVSVVTPDVAPGQQFWRVVAARWWNEQEAGGRHHIYMTVLTPEGKPGRETPLIVVWPSGDADVKTNGKTGFDAANFPMSPSMNEFSVAVDNVYLSETLIGIGMGANGNPNAHTSTGVTFQLVTMPQAAQPEPPTPTDPPQEQPPVPVPAGDDWQRIYEFIRGWEGGWADNPNDPGGATNKGVTFGTFKRWRESRGLPTPTKDDLRAITDAEVEQIFYEWYYKASGADALAFPLSLAVTDLAVNGGVGRAQQALNEAGHDFVKYMAWRIEWHTRISNFEHFGKAWIRRCADVLREGSI